MAGYKTDMVIFYVQNAEFYMYIKAKTVEHAKTAFLAKYDEDGEFECRQLGQNEHVLGTTAFDIAASDHYEAGEILEERRK